MALADFIHFSDKLHKFNLFIILTIIIHIISKIYYYKLFIFN